MGNDKTGLEMGKGEIALSNSARFKLQHKKLFLQSELSPSVLLVLFL